MRLQKQLNLHDPAQGIFGDCMRTVLACLLDLDPVEVPHFNDRTDGRTDEDVCRIMNAWIREQGLALISTNYAGETPIEDVLAAANYGSFGMPFLLSGTSRTGCDHVVICNGPEIVWDPSRVDSGIIGPMSNGLWLVEWLVKPLRTEAVH